MSALGRAIGIAVVLGLFVFAFGIWLGWFDVDTRREEQHGDHEYGVDVRVDKEKIREDIRRTGEEVEEIIPGTVAGTVLAVDAPSGTVQIRPDGTEDVVALRVDGETDFTFSVPGRPEKGNLESLEVGDRIDATYESEGGIKLARKIEVEASPPSHEPHG